MESLAHNKQLNSQLDLSFPSQFNFNDNHAASRADLIAQFESFWSLQWGKNMHLRYHAELLAI